LLRFWGNWYKLSFNFRTSRKQEIRPKQANIGEKKVEERLIAPEHVEKLAKAIEGRDTYSIQGVISEITGDAHVLGVLVDNLSEGYSLFEVLRKMNNQLVHDLVDALFGFGHSTSELARLLQISEDELVNIMEILDIEPSY
jgi:hypothetical protein